MEYSFNAETAFLVVEEEEIPMPPLAMAYVPMQQWSCVYEDGYHALDRGTIFPCLDKPFLEGMCPNVS